MKKLLFGIMILTSFSSFAGIDKGEALCIRAVLDNKSEHYTVSETKNKCNDVTEAQAICMKGILDNKSEHYSVSEAKNSCK